MIKIAFCDDDITVLDDIRVLFNRYKVENDRDICYADFRSPWDLLAEIEHGNRFDIIFLDVLMPGENGIDTAAEIRNYDSNVKIIFLTSSAEYAVQSYTVGAYYYQLKPISADSFFRLMDSVISVCEKDRSDSLILRCKSGITRIEIQHIEYCEVIHRTLYIHLSDGSISESIGSLDELFKQLASYGSFLRPHRSYLINLNYVKSLSYQSITMYSLAEIPIPRGKYNNIKDMYLEFAFKNKQVLL
ncbi:MAG: response regulator transcription factor [Clostridia bacterium]|nr:response regulator transcription factor [Clostridia bacterium]